MRGVICLWTAVVICLSGSGWYYRVVARDDTPAAQAEKYRVRDAVLAVMPGADLEAVQAAVDGVARGKAEIRFWAPEGHVAWPTLYITLGKGKGQNCWGVLYQGALKLAQEPPDDEEREETAEEERTDEEDTEEEVTFVWPLWTWFRGLLGI